MQTFESIYNEHYSNITKWLCSKINNVEAAEDIAADIFVKVHENLNEYDNSQSKMKTWVFTIAKNHLIDYFRKRKLDTTSMSDLVDDEGNETFKHINSSTPQKILENNELGDAITAAINELPAAQKTIADLFLVQELSHEEISVELGGIPIGTIKGTIHRAKQMLQTRLLNF